MGIEVSITGSGNTEIDIPGVVYEEYSQSFPSGSGFNLLSVSLKLNLGAGSPGTVYCDIYAVDGNDFPTGSSLGRASVEAATLNTSPSWSFKLFTFSPLVTLSASTQYAFVISVSSGTPSTDYINIGTNGSDTYANGILGRYNGSVWSDANNTYPATIRSPDAPGKATTPIPIDDQSGVKITGTDRIKKLQWTAPSGETPDYLVYFRAEGDSWVLQETITDDSTEHVLSGSVLAALNYYSIYEWRVDTREYGLTTTGDTWTFISQISDVFTDYTRRSDYDAGKVWQPGTGWVDPNTFEFAGGGQYKEQVVVVGHKVIYFGDL
jgi:hypothetical protein